jgi:hypothetical protein
MIDKPPSNLPVIVTRRILLQRACMAGAFVAISPMLATAQSKNGLTPAQQGIDFAGEFANPNWKPLFFTDEQNETMLALCDAILPATDSPGAKQAMANRYADLVLSAESPETQAAFVKSLQYIDAESARVYRKPFRALSTDEQVEVLIPMAFPMQPTPDASVPIDKGYENFTRVKALIVEGYYSSEIGDTELGWDGAYSHGVYEGCEAEKNTGEKK